MAMRRRRRREEAPEPEGAPGTLPLSEYKPLPEWMREEAEGPFQRDRLERERQEQDKDE